MSDHKRDDSLDRRLILVLDIKNPDKKVFMRLISEALAGHVSFIKTFMLRSDPRTERGIGRNGTHKATENVNITWGMFKPIKAPINSADLLKESEENNAKS